MLLRALYLYLNPEEYPDSVVTPFGFRTRYVCNYVQRRLRPLKFQSDGFDKICVQGRPRPNDVCRIVPEHAALPEVSFDQQSYDRLGPNEQHEFYLEMLGEGLAKCARYHAIPLEFLMNSIEEFRRGGFKNAWVHKTRTFRQFGLRGALLCRLDPDAFSLTLQLERKDGAIVFNKEILHTKPDELIFAHQFKDFHVDGDTLIVADSFSKPMFTLSLATIH